MPMSQSDYDLLPRTSSSDTDYSFNDAADVKGLSQDEPQWVPLRRWRRKARRWAKRAPIHGIKRLMKNFGKACRPIYMLILLASLLLWQLLFNESYGKSSAPAFEIQKGESVFIAANIIDEDLIMDHWGRSIQGLVELVGEENVFVSVYGRPGEALEDLSGRLKCGKRLVDEKQYPVNMSAIPRTTLPTGESRMKRIAYLAEVRNKALEPLAELNKKGKRFDKVLFINDVFFDPIDAARLLWGTNINQDGKSEYKAVCAADFITSWKYYDTFATRDAEGYSIGVPIFPWFANEGDAVTRKDILAGRDNVRVKSCWGGMVAFEGKYFQDSAIDTTATKKSSKKENTTPDMPLRFRSEPEPFWDSSECCLIHADIMSLPSISMLSSTVNGAKVENSDTGIYMNPYVRVAYSKTAWSWIGFAKRWERLFALPQAILNRLANMPVLNIRREEAEGEIIKDRVWVSLDAKTPHSHSDYRKEQDLGDEDSTWQRSGVTKLEKRATVSSSKSLEEWAHEGYYMDFNRTATRGGFCGVRQLLVVKEDAADGEGNWDNLQNAVPPLEN